MLFKHCHYGFSSTRLSTRISKRLRLTLSPLTQRLSTTPFRYQIDDDVYKDNDPSTTPPQIVRYATLQAKYKYRKKSKTVILDAPSLGKPGEIVLVSHYRRPRRHTLHNDKSQTTSSHHFNRSDSSLILDEVDAGQSSSQVDIEAPLLLDEIRTKYSSEMSTLTDENWIRLRDEVEQSFTHDQLSKYIMRYLTSPMPPEGRSDLSSQAKWEAGWKVHPSSRDQKEITEEGVSESRKAKTSQVKGKKALADRILRDCWKLGLAEESGQVEFSLPKHAITLLLRKGRRSFDKLAETHQVEINISKESGLVNIIGKKVPCVNVYEAIKDSVSRIGRDYFKSSIIDDLVSRDGNVSKPRFIEWLSKSYAVALGEETPAEEDAIYYFKSYQERATKVQRDLDLMTRNTVGPAIPFTTYVPASHEGSFYSTDVERSGTWFERKQRWLRWSMPRSPKDIEGVSSVAFFSRQPPDMHTKILYLLQQPTSKGEGSTLVGGASQTYTANIGKCLFLAKSNSTQRSASASQLSEWVSPRTFVKDVPKVTSFLAPLRPFPGTSGGPFYKFRLTPSITNTDPLPILEIEVETKSARSGDLQPSDLVLTKVKEIIEENSVDFLLPESSQDIRFTRSVFFDLYDRSQTQSEGHYHGRSEGQTLVKAIQGFLNNMPFRYHESGPQLLLPTFCKLPLLGRAIRPRLIGGDLTSYKTQESADEVEDAGRPSIKAKYCLPPVIDFAGTQIQYYDFGGERLSFNYHESRGIFPKTTTDLKLEMNILKDSLTSPPVRPGEDTLRQEFHSFYRTACMLAFDLSTE